MTSPLLSTPRTIGALVAWGRRALAEAGITQAPQEATWILEHALGMKRHQLVRDAEARLSPERWARVEGLVMRRVSGEPLQYVLGTQEFCGLELAVSPAVLIPRPETELLVQEVIRRSAAHAPAILVDVGTGSGCLAVTLATILKDTKILATDRSPEALAVARWNAKTHGVEDRIEWHEGDLLAPLKQMALGAGVDVIVSNPPYIAEAEWGRLQAEVRLFEPRMALVGGPVGTEFHERLLRDSREHLSPEGLLLMEVGQGQAPAVREMVNRKSDYDEPAVLRDAAGIERVVIARRRG